MEYVIKGRIKPTRLKEMPIVGAPLPLDIELKPVPSVWGAGITKYSYIYSGGRVYIIDPSNYTVVKEINWFCRLDSPRNTVGRPSSS